MGEADITVESWDSQQRTVRAELVLTLYPELPIGDLEAYWYVADGLGGEPLRIEATEWTEASIDLEAPSDYASYPRDAAGPHLSIQLVEFQEGMPHSSLPIEVAISQGLRTEVATSGYAEEAPDLLGPGSGVWVGLVVDRSLRTRLFTYAVLFLPAAILLGAVFRRRKHSRSTVGWESAVALLAVLPIREVLVPDGLQAPTFVDGILAAQIALGVWLYIFAEDVLAPRRSS